MYILDFILSYMDDDANTEESKARDLIENLFDI